MNKVDEELEQFMKSSEHECHKYKRMDIEWSPLAGVWIHQQWLPYCIQNYLAGKTRDPRNLIKACRKQGVKDPRHITQDELRTEFYVCECNLNILAKHGPYFCRKFLKSLVTSAKRNGDATRATKIMGILQKEASQKRL